MLRAALAVSERVMLRVTLAVTQRVRLLVKLRAQVAAQVVQAVQVVETMALNIFTSKKFIVILSTVSLPKRRVRALCPLIILRCVWKMALVTRTTPTAHREKISGCL